VISEVLTLDWGGKEMKKRRVWFRHRKCENVFEGGGHEFFLLRLIILARKNEKKNNEQQLTMNVTENESDNIKDSGRYK
jgi:hypothetical protein